MRCQHGLWSLLLLSISTPSLAADPSSQDNLNLIWIMIAAAMVFFMQAGFTALEAGFIRAKNSINVAIKNVSDLIMTITAFWFLGFGLMFGNTLSGWIGTDTFQLEGQQDPFGFAFFTFQAVFAGTAATIVSGAIAERVKFVSYLIIALVIGALIYPVVGHWIWGGALIDGASGWLADKGFVDFAGSTVVHSTGAWVGLAGVIILGPRLGRFDKDGNPREIPGHNLALATIGVFILWFGWFGFNGGSTLTGDASVTKIILNTLLAAALGGVTNFVLSMGISQTPQVEKMLNGVLGGLVGITAGCDAVDPTGAVLIGITSGMVVYGAEYLMLYVFKLDDPVNAIAAHGFAGAWGTLALAIFAPAEALPAGDNMAQLAIQAQGVFSCFVWSFGLGVILFLILKKLNLLRVPPEDEEKGLNVSEHGSKMIWLETMTAIRDIVETGDLSQRVEIEHGTEMGEVAASFNKLLDQLEDDVCIATEIANGNLNLTISPRSDKDRLSLAMNQMLTNLRTVVTQVQSTASAVNRYVGELNQYGEELHDTNDLLQASIAQVSHNVCITQNAAQNMTDKAENGSKVISETVHMITNIQNSMQGLAGIINKLDNSSQNIGEIVETIEDISDQTNLLALNAAIEAARAGEHGLGFSVVASEVRDLASRSISAAHEVAAIVTEISKETSIAVQQTEENSNLTASISSQTTSSIDVLADMNEAISNVSEMMNTAVSATREQESHSVKSSEVVKQVADIASHLQHHAQALSQAIRFFDHQLKPA